MIVGVGLDVVSVERIARAMRNPRFVRRVLTEAERRVCRTPECVAGRWAAKEAIAKALRFAMSWQDVEILPGPAGAPTARIEHPGFDQSSCRVHLSITHERGHAAAVAVVESGA
ncbi:MAG: holo-ACP synthase [Fimbriimonas ginsengisoli]|uniref:Holo-[acyl-carrier-protein] synthase n=1 Tax=Fimbriimonas ginsengisoli TaxID=1005039 RepID=A0A931M0K8_FIMGI|nr:holo-ACP synthase [Fimbriimonas ginsengisoli]MBI3721611.1 holo-ACP synthase [Fimbriimonas ginsengisoli]